MGGWPSLSKAADVYYMPVPWAVLRWTVLPHENQQGRERAGDSTSCSTTISYSVLCDPPRTIEMPSPLSSLKEGGNA